LAGTYLLLAAIYAHNLLVAGFYTPPEDYKQKAKAKVENGNAAKVRNGGVVTVTKNGVFSGKGDVDDDDDDNDNNDDDMTETALRSSTLPDGNKDLDLKFVNSNGTGLIQRQSQDNCLQRQPQRNLQQQQQKQKELQNQQSQQHYYQQQHSDVKRSNVPSQLNGISDTHNTPPEMSGTYSSTENSSSNVLLSMTGSFKDDHQCLSAQTVSTTLEETQTQYIVPASLRDSQDQATTNHSNTRLGPRSGRDCEHEHDQQLKDENQDEEKTTNRHSTRNESVGMDTNNKTDNKNDEDNCDKTEDGIETQALLQKRGVDNSEMTQTARSRDGTTAALTASDDRDIKVPNKSGSAKMSAKFEKEAFRQRAFTAGSLGGRGSQVSNGVLGRSSYQRAL
jgi:hypothetical protein